MTDSLQRLHKHKKHTNKFPYWEWNGLECCDMWTVVTPAKHNCGVVKERQGKQKKESE